MNRLETWVVSGIFGYVAVVILFQGVRGIVRAWGIEL